MTYRHAGHRAACRGTRRIHCVGQVVAARFHEWGGDWLQVGDGHALGRTRSVAACVTLVDGNQGDDKNGMEGAHAT